MAFKGTERIGTRSYRQEAPLLDALDEGVLLITQQACMTVASPALVGIPHFLCRGVVVPSYDLSVTASWTNFNTWNKQVSIHQ